MLTAVIAIIGTLLPTILANKGVIGASTETLISSLLTPFEELIAALRGGTNGTQTALAALAAAQGVITALKANTNLPATVLAELTDVETDIAAALSAYAKAGGGLDLSLYTQTSEVS